MARRRRSYPEPEVWNDPRLVWVEGLTERGAPTGVAEEAWASPRGNANRPGWARAQEVLRTAFAKLAPGAQLELGRVRAVASGMSRETYGAFAEPQPDPDGLAGGYVVRLPRPGTGEELQRRSYAEARLLWRLASLELPFEIPVTLAVVPDPHGPAMVQRAIDGFPLRMSEGTLDVVGQVAARVHAIRPRRPTGSCRARTGPRARTRRRCYPCSKARTTLTCAKRSPGVARICPRRRWPRGRSTETFSRKTSCSRSREMRRRCSTGSARSWVTPRTTSRS